MNWIVTVARNNLDLLKQALTSFRAQDVPIRVLVVNNGSTDGTASYLHASTELQSIHFNPQHSLSRAWNSALTYLFSLSGSRRVDRVLVTNTDVILHPSTWRLLAATELPFVTAVGMHSIDRLQEWSGTPIAAPRPHPDFSCFMISRDCYTTVGPFDEAYVPAWFEDNDYHVRMHQAGIRAVSIDLPFYHVDGGAMTMKRANDIDREKMHQAFNSSRARFVERYGCDPSDTRAYEKLFTDATFGIDRPEERSDVRGSQGASKAGIR